MAVTSLSSAAEEIKSRCNIVDVISPLVTIKRAGSNYKGCCPFHKEKTPSFVVSEQKQIYHCFGCGKSGDVIRFIQEYYNMSFPDAVRRLAQQYGIEIDDYAGEMGKKKEPYYEANRMAARFYFDSFTKKANPGYSYMYGRGIQPETVKKFGLGYADDGWQTLSDYMLAQGTPESLLLELGLSAKSSKNDKLYDKFRSRVMFPIFNTMGKVIGFGGRTIVGDDAKYLNSQESIVFEKKRNLYGLSLTKKEIQDEGYAILVEGYMDVIGLYQGGVHNVCAALGTALTPEQAQLLKRYTKKAVLCLDSDAAGINAAMRGCDVLRAAGLEVRVMHVDDGKDPDEYIKKHGADEFRALLEKTTQTDIDFKIGLIAQKYDLNDLSQALRFLKEVADVLRPLSPVEADLYIPKVAKMGGISEGALRREIETPSKKAPAPPPARRDSQEEEAVKAGPKPDESRVMTERMLIKLCLQRSDLWPKLQDYPEAFVTVEGDRIAAILSGLYRENSDFDLKSVRERLDESALAYLDRILDEVITGDEEEAFRGCIEKLQRRRDKLRIQEIMDILSMAEGEDDAQLNELMRELAALQRKYIK
ncbi:MAG: DNA primase [Firmicutes bacterium]|nr:DNA primase [Bacillota bacterium]